MVAKAHKKIRKLPQIHYGRSSSTIISEYSEILQNIAIVPMGSREEAKQNSLSVFQNYHSALVYSSTERTYNK